MLFARQKSTTDLSATAGLAAGSPHIPEHSAGIPVHSFLDVQRIEYLTRALSELAKVLVTQVVYPMTCRFVTRRATKKTGRATPFGHAWARTRVDMTIMVQCPLRVEDDMVPLARARLPLRSISVLDAHTLAAHPPARYSRVRQNVQVLAPWTINASV